MTDSQDAWGRPYRLTRSGGAAFGQDCAEMGY